MRSALEADGLTIEMIDRKIAFHPGPKNPSAQIAPEQPQGRTVYSVVLPGFMSDHHAIV